ncbi:hypothetical protein VKT23_016297 [Stygiomarasmius scandens]|uniref:Small secreted protein n=1 Tax=Marasmiellus scandens TaxID=2682957 RepID=A0ABR1IV55_9AGAR
MKLSTFVAFAAFATAVSATAIVKRVDNRIAVDIPADYTLDTFCAEWRGACLATIAIKQPGANNGIYCEQAPQALYPNAANVYCETSPTTLYTDDVIGYLGLTRA